LWKSPPGLILGKVISGGGNMLVGYILLSKGNGSQTLVPQRDALLATAGGALDRLSEDLSSFRDNDHPGLVARLKAIQPSNILVVWKLDRLGQNLKHLIIRADIPERVLPPPRSVSRPHFSNKQQTSMHWQLQSSVIVTHDVGYHDD
jgi:Resolvase, N terminal domain